MKNNKGFTLVEVVSVIVLLGLIASILVPSLGKSIKNSKKSSFEESLNGIIRTVEDYLASNPSEISKYREDYTNISDLSLDADNINIIESGEFMIDDDSVVHLRNVSNGEYCGEGFKNNWVIKEGKC